MSGARAILCPSCGFKNVPPLANDRCVSCGWKVEDPASRLATGEGLPRAFSVVWFAVSLLVMAVLTAAVVVGLPSVVPVFDFEGAAGMLVAIPVWFVGGMLVGLISPSGTFIEPVVATFLVASPTAFLLHAGQTVKTMPAFLYVLLAAVGLLFALIGAYAGERIQMKPPPARAPTTK